VTQRTVRRAAWSDHVPVTLRRLSLPEHGVLELVIGLGLIAAPFLLGFGPAGVVACLAAGAILAGLGLGDGVPISAHMTYDVLLAIGLLAAGVGLAGSGERAAGGVLAAAAAGELALSLGTRWTRRA
jgi:hypothetical protein